MLTLPTGPRWTQEEAIAFESARECITDLAGIYTGLIEEAKSRPFVSQAEIDALRAKRSELVHERAQLHLQDTERVANIRRVYGAKIREFRAAESHQRHAA